MYKAIAIALMLVWSITTYASPNVDMLRAIEMDDEKTARTMIIKGYNINEQTDDGVPMVSYAMTKGAVKVVRLFLMSKRLEVDQSDLKGDTPVMVASILDKPEWVAALLSKGASIKASGQWTPLHYAASSGSLKSMGFLLEAGADVNALSPNGTTPMMMAARENKELAVKLLLNSGADPTLVNQSGYNAAGYAMRAKNKDLALEIMKKAKEMKQQKGAEAPRETQ